MIVILDSFEKDSALVSFSEAGMDFHPEHLEVNLNSDESNYRQERDGTYSYDKTVVAANLDAMQATRKEIEANLENISKNYHLFLFDEPKITTPICIMAGDTAYNYNAAGQQQHNMDQTDELKSLVAAELMQLEDGDRKSVV